MNDNQPTPLDGAEAALAHGQAALLLVESLIHGLCEKSAMTLDETLVIVDRAVDVQWTRASEALGAQPSAWHAHTLLDNIATSLRNDVSDVG